MSKRAEERMIWVLRRIAGTPCQGVSAWDEDFVDAFVEAFPESNKTLRYYLMGPNSSPMLNRAAKRAEAREYLRAGVLGTMDARQYNQRTWCRYWSITGKGQDFLLKFDKWHNGVGNTHGC